MNASKKQKNWTIIALISSALTLLCVVLFVNPAAAPADFAVKDRDYQIVTAAVQNGSEGLYILDQRSGLVAVFIYDPAKGLTIKGSQAIAGAFGNMAR